VSLERSKPSLLIVCFSNIQTDSRVRRHAQYLSEHYDVTVAGWGVPLQKVHFVELPQDKGGRAHKVIRVARLLSGAFEAYYWGLEYIQRSFELLHEKRFDYVMANDLLAVPMCHALADKHGARLIVDAHEYSPRQFDNSLYFNVFFKRFYTYLSSRYLSGAYAFITVTQSIAREYERCFGIKGHVLRNVVPYHDLSPSPVRSDHIRLVHVGICNRHRGLEGMLDLIHLLDERYTLDFYLIPADASYYRYLQKKGAASERVRFNAPLAQEELCAVLNDYDVGLYPQSPKSFNYRNGLPNKIFEFIQARLAVAVWPISEMRQIVNAYGNGVVSVNYSLAELAELLNDLSRDEIAEMKRRSSACARENHAELEYQAMQEWLAAKIEERNVPKEK